MRWLPLVGAAWLVLIVLFLLWFKRMTPARPAPTQHHHVRIVAEPWPFDWDQQCPWLAPVFDYFNPTAPSEGASS